MNADGSQLARAMLSIHAAEMDQAARCPDWRSEARFERGIMLHRSEKRALWRLGSLLEKAGRRLQEYGGSRSLSLERDAAQS